MTADVLAFLPSPPQGVWNLGPLPLRAYALCIIIGIVVAVWWGGRRWVARGGQPGEVLDVAIWAVPFGLIGGRIYHVATDYNTYFGDGNKTPIDAIKIWDGGLGIWGAIFFGAVGAWIGCRWYGIRLPAFADALAPPILLAQAIGRLGNYFNQELYGGETTLPWGLEIYYREANGVVGPGLVDGVSTGQVYQVVHPTFLYELLWNVFIVIVLVALDYAFRIGHGRLFALYVAGYSLGRFGIEMIRTDYAQTLFGYRINLYTAAIIFILALVYFFVARKGRETGLEMYWPERAEELAAEGAVGYVPPQDDYVDDVDADDLGTDDLGEDADLATEVIPTVDGDQTDDVAAADAAETTVLDPVSGKAAAAVAGTAVAGAATAGRPESDPHPVEVDESDEPDSSETAVTAGADRDSAEADSAVETAESGSVENDSGTADSAETDHVAADSAETDSAETDTAAAETAVSGNTDSAAPDTADTDSPAPDEAGIDGDAVASTEADPTDEWKPLDESSATIVAADDPELLADDDLGDAFGDLPTAPAVAAGSAAVAAAGVASARGPVIDDAESLDDDEIPAAEHDETTAGEGDETATGDTPIGESAAVDDVFTVGEEVLAAEAAPVAPTAVDESEDVDRRPIDETPVELFAAALTTGDAGADQPDSLDVEVADGEAAEVDPDPVEQGEVAAAVEVGGVETETQEIPGEPPSPAADVAGETPDEDAAERAHLLDPPADRALPTEIPPRDGRARRVRGRKRRRGRSS